ncbi:eukaryotic translation initiation factor 4E-like isoform X2 [Acanthaster planci]|uniref:Eukaryotic translation initiation factor 4E-like isoform X2 n=1 Tax=Acanthaster planci TaxID=133434 RepID=A0A8B7ZQE9_ACAPL|nr:eukaryotic translation initiation factor 4E-like isoform X2 [Acanthaster planci]
MASAVAVSQEEKPHDCKTTKSEGENETPTQSKEVVGPQEVIKHPLQNKWALWFFKNDKSKSWADNLRIITSFDTVEDFWALFNHIQCASKLQSGCDYSLFKDGIKPMWEDGKNKAGGRWLVNLGRPKPQDVDRFWLESLLFLIGESCDDESELVNGGVINVRSKGNKIAVWTGNYKKEEGIMKIGRGFKEVLHLPPKTLISYEAHADTMSKTGSVAKSRYVV